MFKEMRGVGGVSHGQGDGERGASAMLKVMRGGAGCQSCSR